MDKEANKKFRALILGASSGFGGATAMKLAEDGYNVIGIHLDRQATMPNVEKIINHIKSCGREAHFYNVNAADQFKRTEIITELKAKLGVEAAIKIIMSDCAAGLLIKATSACPARRPEAGSGVTKPACRMPHTAKRAKEGLSGPGGLLECSLPCTPPHVLCGAQGQVVD